MLKFNHINCGRDVCLVELVHLKSRSVSFIQQFYMPSYLLVWVLAWQYTMTANSTLPNLPITQDYNWGLLF